MTGAHLPALQVVLPLVAAPLCVLLNGARAAWIAATATSFVSLAIAVALLVRVLDTGTISYALGGWAAPWGIEYRIDVMGAFMLVIVAGISSAVLPYARASVEKEVPSDRIYLFYAAWLLALTGLLGIAATGDAFNLFVFLEISSLSSYVLISLGQGPRALTAAFRYLIMGTIGATFILIGIGFLYMLTGTLNMADLAARLPAVSASRTTLVAFAFLAVGTALKLALFPLHAWLPNAYTYAPSAVSAFLAATATKVGVYVMLRFFFSVFGTGYSFELLDLGRVLLALSLLAALVGSAAAIFQRNLKRMLAYSSVAQIGYMMLGVSFASVSGLTGGIVHLFNHALMKCALFLALGNVVYRLGSASIDGIAGLGRRMPWTMAAFVAGGLSLIGVPLTAGFVSKWYLVQAALEADRWWVAAWIVFTSLLAVVYVWRVVEAAYFRPAAEGVEGVREAPPGMLVPLFALVAASVYFGVSTELSVGVSQHAARLLLGAGP